MRTFALLCLLPLVGCGSYQSYEYSRRDMPLRDTHTVAVTPVIGEVSGRPTLADPIPIPGQPTILVPFAIESEKGLFEKDDPYRKGGGLYDYAVRYSIAKPTYSYFGDVRWHNALVRDLKTGDQWPILDRRGVIAHWQVFFAPNEDKKPPVSRGLAFIVVIDDTDHDGLLDDRDARVAILTDPDGRHPRVVTPPDAQVWTVIYDAEKDAAFFRIATDTDRDGKFTLDDVALPYFVPLRAAGPVERVIDDTMLRRAQGLLGPGVPPPAR